MSARSVDLIRRPVMEPISFVLGVCSAAMSICATKSGFGAQSGLSSRIHGAEVAASPRLIAEAKPVLVLSRISRRPESVRASTSSAEPSDEALSTTTNSAGGGSRAATASKHAGSVPTWSWVTTMTA